MVCLEILLVVGVNIVGRSPRHDAGKVPLDHRERAAGEISESVREIGVVALLESLP
jgi:hypothetical protein